MAVAAAESSRGLMQISSSSANKIHPRVPQTTRRVKAPRFESTTRARILQRCTVTRQFTELICRRPSSGVLALFVESHFTGCKRVIASGILFSRFYDYGAGARRRKEGRAGSSHRERKFYYLPLFLRERRKARRRREREPGVIKQR